MMLRATMMALLAAAPALAEEPDAGVTHHTVTSFGPILLILPLLEVTQEVFVGDKVSIGVIGGLGSMKITPAFGESTRVTIWELGASVRGYPVQSVERGFHIGGEVDYIGASAALHDVKAVVDGLVIGPMAGYKWQFGSGFVIDLYGGLGWVGLHGHASDSSGTTAQEERTDVLPRLKFNLGWTF